VVGPVASGFGAIAAGLLSAEQARERETGGVMERMPSIPPRRRLEAHGALTGLAVVLFLVLWALSSSTYFWPAWILPPLVIALAVHAWSVLVAERPAVIARFGGSRALARRTGTGGGLALYLIVIWSLSNSSYFWPVWPLLVVATVLGGQAIMIMLGSERETEMAQRIEKLETTRAGAVDVQDSELRRIERDLHDGAQARLVALGMSLGMAEQKLSEDPARAGELLAEARAGAEAALRELRDLARGIHPPVLADRGLEAALRALANSAPLDVRLSVDVAERPSSAVESAAYFVAAEALANAAKHAQAQTLEIRIVRMADVLLLQVRDDGVGGADPSGSGLSGLRSRVEALDGSLQVTSPPGGPTTIRAQLPCG
jgi:signal transduction histidine kinase